MCLIEESYKNRFDEVNFESKKVILYSIFNFEAYHSSLTRVLMNRG